MTFRVGQKVVCVDDSPTDFCGGRELTLRGVYTIRWIGIASPGRWPKYLGVRLVEMHRGVDEFNPSVVDMPFAAARFRPIVEKKTDIGFAHEILRKVSVPNEFAS